ncbi:SET domain,Rubisco LSMT, substrate-binding domain [Cinara cedri]|uniref:protein-histidine N-methyltransferase n=1 Tax=Cinara cedri TaxID=506608 RepID=A0A5E4MQE8_9HEMI|nr:SET domain,Rubisco LSMT, substrate-binding domain [Cinara cedri]
MDKKTKITSTSQKKTLAKMQSVKLNDCKIIVLKLVDQLLDATSMMSNTPSIKEQWSIHLVIVNLLSKINQLEAEFDLKPLSQRNDQSIEKLTKWATKNGAILNGVEIHQFQDYGYGMKANKPITEGDKLVTVPKSLMMTEENISASPLWKLHSQDMMLRNMPNVALAIFILVESLRKDKKSFWHPYLTTLPETYSTPVYFEVADLEALKGSPAFEAALKLNRNIARQYAYFKKLFQLSDDPASVILKDTFTYEYYRWAVSTLMSRQNTIPNSDDPPANVSALIPLWDMFNHHEGTLSTDFVKADNTCVCYANSSYLCNDQVYIFYGVRTNADFLVHNGFVYPENKHDAVKIRLGVSRSDPFYTLRLRLLQTLSLPPLAEFNLNVGPQPLHGKLLAFVRIFNMDQKTLEDWIGMEEKHCLNLMDSSVTLEPVLEKKCWEFLQVRINLLIKQYPPPPDKNAKLSKFQLLARKQIEKELAILKMTLQYIGKHMDIYVPGPLKVVKAA